MTSKVEKVLIGRSAQGGIADGRPAIVLSSKDLDSVAVGDVLVAAETDITFVPAMQRAAAIVTENGGRFCHAAVWARENNKPVLLQVERATMELAGVAWVMVDADNGFLRWTA